MNKINHLIVKINEYKLRYETETYHPELNGLLIELRQYLTLVSISTKDLKRLIEEGKI